MVCLSEGSHFRVSRGEISRERCVRTDELGVVELVLLEQDLEDTIQEGEVGTRSELQMDTAVLDGGVSDRSPPRVHDDQERRFRSGQSVEDAGPKDRLSRRHVVADHEQGIAVVLREGT